MTFPWIDLPIFEENGEPMHDRGIVEKVPGMFFVGLHFLYAMSSATLIGVGRDAKRIVGVLASRVRSGSGGAQAISVEVPELAVFPAAADDGQAA